MMRVRLLFTSVDYKACKAYGSGSYGIREMSYSVKEKECPASVNDIQYESEQTARPYRDIPGPRPLPLIGNTFRFVQYIGEYGNMPLLTQLRMLRDKYGDMVKLEGIPNRRRTIFIFNSELCEKVYRTEGPWPSRIAMESLHHYRVNRDCIYEGKYGLTTTQGKEWYDFRTKVNQHMMQPRAIKPHVSQINDVCEEFVEKMRKLRDAETLELPASFNNELSKWALESICSIALDRRLGCLQFNLPNDSDGQQMIDCVHEIFELLYRLELLPSLWKVYNTSTLRRFFTVMDTLNRICIKHINQVKKRLSTEPENSLKERSVLEKLVRIDEAVARVMALDMITAGVDTSSNTAGALLYQIARHPHVQAKLHKEVMSVLPEKFSPVIYETLNNIPYLKACLKEGLRMSPVAIGTLRTMREDTVLGGYVIPKNTDVVACHSVLSYDPKHFPRPKEFIPERWLRESNDMGLPSAKEAHPFAYMPFGFGARTCIGRRFAEFEIEVLLLKIMRNFRIEWHHEPMQFRSRLINTIASPLRLKLVDL